MMVHAEYFVCMNIILKRQGSHKRVVIPEGLICMGITIRGKISTGVLQGVWSVIRDFAVHLSTRPSGSTC